MHELYTVLIDSKPYQIDFLFPNIHAQDTIPAGLFFHASESIVNRMNIASSVGVEGARSHMAIVSLKDGGVQTGIDMALFEHAAAQDQPVGVTIYTREQIFIAPVVAMREVEQIGIEAIVYLYSKEAESIRTAVFEEHIV